MKTLRIDQIPIGALTARLSPEEPPSLDTVFAVLILLALLASALLLVA